jgi:hypothetical protein
MKRNIIIGLFVFLFFAVQSQVVFSPPGAAWAYNYKMTMGGAPGAPTYLDKIKYTRDSIMGNDTVKVLVHKRFFLQCSSMSAGPTLIRQSGDTIFMNNFATNHTWQILYNFRATAGQSWQSVLRTNDYDSLKPLCTYTVTVDSTGTVLENGYSLRRLYVKYRSPSTYYNFPGNTIQYPAVITERFGCSAFMFNYYNESYGWCDHDWFTRFLCYSDPQFGNKQFTSFPCDYQNPLSAEGNLHLNGIVQIFPNPVQKSVLIRTNVDIYQVRIYSVTGALVYTFSSGFPVYEIDPGELQNGLYFLYAFDKQRLIGIGKFIKD